MAAFNLIDEILSDFEPNYSHLDMDEAAKSGEAFKELSGDEADTAFLDGIAGDTDHNSAWVGVTASSDNHRVRATAALSADGVLGDAMLTLEQAKKEEPEERLKTFEEVERAANELLPKSASKDLTKAILRIKRIASKTPEQMAEDGVKTASDYADPVLAPGWAPQIRKDVKLIRRAYRQMVPPKAKKASTVTSDITLGKKQMSDAEVKNYVNKLLNDGWEPTKIASHLEKMAEVMSFSKEISSEYLNQNAGIIGYAVITPNAFMNKCADTHHRFVTKLGGVKAHSVKQVKACTDCQYFSKSASKRCNLYQLPIVANGKELFPIINQITKGASNKKAALLRLANREDSKGPANEVKRITADKQIVAHYGSNEDAEQKRRTASFTEKDVLTLHKAGAKIADIYNQGVSKVGSVQAKTAVQKFIAGLKGTKTKVSLTQIDCTKLKGKLSASNPIIGAKKCATCTYRRGMSCGLTGGTLERFEGMQHVRTAHKVAAGAPKDGTKMLAEYELTSKTAAPDIELLDPKYASIDIDGGR